LPLRVGEPSGLSIAVRSIRSGSFEHLKVHLHTALSVAMAALIVGRQDLSLAARPCLTTSRWIPRSWAARCVITRNKKRGH